MVVYLHDRSGAARDPPKGRRRPAGAHREPYHVRDEHGVAQALLESERKLGAPYILVNNARGCEPHPPWLIATTEEMGKRLKTDL